MSFSLTWVQSSFVLVSGALAVAGCRTPGEGLQQTEATTGSGGPVTSNASVTSDTVTGAVSSASGGDVTAAAGTESSTSTTGAGTDGAGGASATGTAEGTTTAGGSSATSTEGTEGGASTGGVNTSNLIDNSDFQSASANCEVDSNDWSTEGALNFAGVDDMVCAFCIVLETNESGQLNWSGNSGVPPTLNAGTTYKFSFDVWSDEGTTPTLSAKVGQPVEPYTGFLEESVSVPGSSETQSFTFTMDATDQAGIAFIFSAGAEWGKLCIDNVSIEAQ